jgi:hypothetical protein
MHGGEKHTGHPEIWAVLTIITFPIVLIASELLDVGQWWSIIFAFMATFCILVLETIVRGRLWPFEKGFINSIGHPETPFRIMVFLGATLLLLETVAVFGAVTDPRFDEGLLSLVIKKECSIRHYSPNADMICRFLTEPKKVATSTVRTADLIDHAVATHAAALWSTPQGMTTCAVRSFLRRIESEGASIREAALVQCTTWAIQPDGSLVALQTAHKSIGAALSRNPDGLYSITRWSENPEDATWEAALGDVAESARGHVEALGILPALIDSLQDESRQKAIDLLTI